MFLITFMNYAVLHASRSVWSAATKDFKTIYDFSVPQIAYMNSCFLGAYAVGGIFTGQLADKYRLKFFIPAMYTAIALSMCSLALMKVFFPTAEEQKEHISIYYCLKIINGFL